MSAWMRRNWREWTFFPALMALVTLWVCLATAPAGDAAEEAAAALPIDCSAGFNTASINCPALPNTPDIAELYDDPGQAPLYEDWAWKSFVALNWPAVEPTSSTNPRFARGYPDYGTHFALGAPNSTPVWGVWKEKRELFSVAGETPGPWNSEVDYFVDFPPCSPADAERIAAMPFPRRFSQSSKSLFNSFDETIQVPSEAFLPVQVRGASVQPRVWRFSRQANNTVVYEVKLNWDYYTYVKDNRLSNDTVKNARAARSGDFETLLGHQAQANQAISFPWRLSPQPAGTPFNASQHYSVRQCEMFNRGSGGSLPPNPCPTGTIQTKSAWVLLTPAEVASGKYHWTEAQYFRDLGPIPGGRKICTAHGVFGLIGFHVIQKTINQGHYIYATWEHVSNDTTPFVYANFFRGNGSIPAGFYPAATASPNAIKVRRDHPIFASTRATTDRYHDLIRAANNASAWLNYQLTGVQFLPVRADSDGANFTVGSDDPSNIGQPFYLANLVIETNWGLQNFQGVPPGLPNGNVPAAFLPTKGFQLSEETKPDDHFIPNPSIRFNRSLGNIGHSRRNLGRVYDMGGCMGCHGVAQADGTDFSFVLLLGQGGADVDTVNGPPE